MLILLISSTILSAILMYFAWIGVGHYKEFSEDEDRDKTSFQLRAMVVGILLVLLSCNAIIGISHYQDKDALNNVVLEKK